VEAITEILGVPDKIGKNVRVLRHVASYAEFQFGDRFPGKSYRGRENGDRISNWMAEIGILHPVYVRLINVYDDDKSLSSIMEDNMVLPYLEKMLELLIPWFISIDLDDTSCVERLNKDHINVILDLSSSAKKKMAFIFVQRNEFSLAESHCHEALSYARRYDGKEEQKTTLLCDAFTVYGYLRSKQCNYADAATFYEEAYNCVAITYNPVHPKVQRAAGHLIQCLTHKGDFYDAERFAQTTLDSLKDPTNGMDQDNEAVAQGYYALGNAILRQNGDLIKAERLARESYRISLRLYGNEHNFVGLSANLLANILRLQGRSGDETRELYECFLASIMNEGPDGINTAFGNSNLGILHSNLAGMVDRQLTANKRKGHLCQAISYATEALRISTKIHGATHPQTIQYAAKLSAISQVLLDA
jgi:tetratricopeptide (TPR) repeat protein